MLFHEDIVESDTHTDRQNGRPVRERSMKLLEKLKQQGRKLQKESAIVKAGIRATVPEYNTGGMHSLIVTDDVDIIETQE